MRDSFGFGAHRALVVTDRVSAFDRALGLVPDKGAVLNQLAAWWFAQLDALDIAHHLVDVVHPNVALVRSVDVLPLEIIVRGYLTGSTTTSAWHAYQHLDRKICGLEMPEGMVKNQRFDHPLLTPTTKEAHGDRPISQQEILQQGWLDPYAAKSGKSAAALWEEISNTAFRMFEMGQRVAAERGLILVDTKYEMGVAEDGSLVVVDEVHTPDCSRFWLRDSYEARLEQGQEPAALDKEFIRRQIVEAGFDVRSNADPSTYVTPQILAEARDRYLDLFQRMTGTVPDLQPKQSVAEVLTDLRTKAL